MTIRVGETGKRIRLITSYDMSSASSLEIKAVPPSGEANTKTWPGTIEAGTLTNITLEDGTTIASVAANESMYYDLAAASDLDEAGNWTLVAIYNDTGASPADIFKSDPMAMTVSDDNYT